MSPKIVTVFVTAFLYLIHHGSAYPSGAPSAACVTLRPAHPPSTDTGSPPFTLEAVPKSSDGSSINVNLTRTDTSFFRGFLIQARDVANDSTVGTFEISGRDDVKQACTPGRGSSVTHVNNDNKVGSMIFPWIAPGGYKGTVHFVGTVVQQNDGTSVYWTGLESEEINVDASDSTATVPTDPPVSTVPPPPALPPVDTSDCGNSQGCFRQPGNCSGTQDCDHLLSWKVISDNIIEFEVSAATTESGTWTAVGFSLDQKMGEDSVVDCIHNKATNEVRVRMSWNPVCNPCNNKPLINDTLGLVEGSLHGSFVDGILHCKFQRYMTINRTRKNFDDFDEIYDLKDKKYFLFLPFGPADGLTIQKHYNLPAISPVEVDTSSTDYPNIGETVTPKYKLVVAHGSLMLIAWMLLASSGVLLPRYFKPIWPGQQVGGKQLWFVLHMPIMISTLVLTVSAVIIIFIEAEGYSTDLENADAAHPIIGFIVLGLVIINPVMALFRPAPDAKNRWIFNWAHFLVGLSAHVLSAVAMLLGVRLSKAQASEWAMWVVVAYAGWHALVEITLALVTRLSKQNNGSKLLDLQDTKQYQANNTLMTIILVTHIAVVTAASVSIIVNIATA